MKALLNGNDFRSAGATSQGRTPLSAQFKIVNRK